MDLRRFDRNRPPAVLLGGLNVARAAGVAGIPVIVASAEADSPAFASRYCAGRVLLPPLDGSGAAAEAVLRLGERLANALGRSVPLLYGNDDYLNLLLQNRGRLAQYYRFILNDPEVAAALIDKERFDAFTRNRGLPAPRALDWNELDAFPGPVLVKPKVKLAWEDSQVYRGLFGGAGKARVFATARELLAIPLAHTLRNELLLQQYIPGGDRQLWSFHGYADEAGRVLAWFTGRKIRTWPALTGVSTYLELARHDELSAIGHQIVARAPLKGVFKIDFKQDPANGLWYMLEVNARFNLWHYLAARNGVSIPRIAYDYLLKGRTPPAPPRFATTRRWLSLRLDYRAYRDLAARGELTRWRWLASLASPMVFDLFAWSDPLPFVRRWQQRLQRRIPRITERLARWPFTAS